MRSFDRRRFLLSSSAAALSLRGFAQAMATPATLRLLDAPGPRVPANFIGLSYETQQLSDPSFFAARNTGLIAQFRALAPTGILRLGGNTSDYGFWKPTRTAVAPPRAPREAKMGDPQPDFSYAVTPAAVANLAAFLHATGWTCLYGINLGTNTPALAAEEAAFVAKALGPLLAAFQLGNEADRFGATIRDPRITGKPWNVAAFLAEWTAMANAIRARVPHATFGLPDTAGNPEWSSAIAEHFSDAHLAVADYPHIEAISHHYYFTGPPANPRANVHDLLLPDPRVETLAATTRAAADRLRVPYRMTEGNSCYRGGKPGLSDVFAAALWAADYALHLAALGYAGVNLHGGDGQMVANSLGGTLPGEALMADPRAPHARPFYTPIAHMGDRFVLQPAGVGLQFAQRFAGARMLQVAFDPGSVNATAYAGELPTGQRLIALLNKDATQPLLVDVPAFRTALILSAPSLTTPAASLTEPTGDRETSTVPPFTAVLLQSVR